ncbi:AAA family ATPase [Nocardia carnea]|uniref:bifunctional aminoglycoside phosphotransferase/ATP-binding protein n=1 Tax=Nocardia carnea TaxID=37328 RepID=UPI0024552DBC|nr:AAA family ATPase [Nocardia carnea]
MNPSSYFPPRPGAAVHETHTGVVFLYGERAYKIKKAITTDFLDFGSRIDRERACRREYELNRRLAPDVYLGVGHFLAPDGDSGEPVLMMRRMPENRRLSTRLADPAADPPRLSTLAAALVRFHRSARRGGDIDRAGTTDAVHRRWTAVLRTLREQPHTLVDPGRLAEIECLALRYLAGRNTLFENRIAGGHIVDGHGDLLAQDIFDLPDGFRILDCLDFDDRLRHVDRLDDIAFLAMDFEFLDRPDLGDEFLAGYQYLSGDDAPPSLGHHYRAYRALVRAKVDTIRSGQGDAAAAGRVRRHLELADSHLKRGRVRLTLVGGLPGTGKTTVATGLAAHTGAQVISSDHVRRELAERGDIGGLVGRYNVGTYSPDNRSRVYTELLELARPLLANGHSVVLDASWADPVQRRYATELASSTESDLVQIRCECSRDVADRRLLQRPPCESDATPTLAHTISAAAGSWPEATALDTTRPPAAVIDDAVTLWRGTTQQHRRPLPVH